jgi:hypothetical protein
VALAFGQVVGFLVSALFSGYELYVFLLLLR